MRRLAIVALAALALSCDHGLAPPPEVQPGFGGMVYFEKGTWPSADSLFNLWIFASEIYPLDSAKVYNGIFANPPTIFFYPTIDKSLPLLVDSLSYSFALPPATYKYVGVIQRYRNDINVNSLRVVGIYATTDNPPIPIPVIVNESDFIGGISIHVNFHKPPPQPF